AFGPVCGRGRAGPFAAGASPRGLGAARQERTPIRAGNERARTSRCRIGARGERARPGGAAADCRVHLVRTPGEGRNGARTLRALARSPGARAGAAPRARDPQERLVFGLSDRSHLPRRGPRRFRPDALFAPPDQGAPRDAPARVGGPRDRMGVEAPGGHPHARGRIGPRALPVRRAHREARRAGGSPAAAGRAWKRKAEETVPAFLFAYLEVYKNPPVAFVNSSGEPLEFVKVHYRVRDRARVLEVLGREFDELADGQYEWVGEEDDLMATLELGKTGLVVRVNSRERLEALEERLAKLLGDAVERTLAAHEDGQQAVRTRRKKSRSKREVDEIPPELVEEIQQM